MTHKRIMMVGQRWGTGTMTTDKYGHWDITLFGEFDPDEFFGFIYEIEELATGRCYIGKKFFRHKRKKTKADKSKFKESDWKEYTSSCEPLKESIEQQGKDNFTFRILSLCAGRSQLTYEECQYQYTRDVLRTKLPNGERKYFNKTIGHLLFAGVEKQSDEAKAKMSAYAKNRTTEHKEKIYSQLRGREFTPEHKAKLTEALLNRPEPHHTGQCREKISETLMGHVVTEETKAKMSAHIKTPEHRRKMALAKLGKPRHFTPEHRAKIAATKLLNKQKKLSGIPT